MFNAYTIKKMLPKLIIAVIAVNVSWYVAIGLLDVANVLGEATKDILLTPFGSLETDVIGSLSGGQQAVVAGAIGAAGVAMFFSSFAIFTPILVGGLLALFVGYIVLVLRQAMIIMLVILSPIILAMWVLPGLENFAKKGFSLFIKLLAMYPIIIALLISGRIVSSVLNNTSGGVANGTATDADLLPRVLALVALFAPYFMIPFVLKFLGGALATISNMANDRSRGLIDGLRKRGGQKSAQNRADLFAGNRWKGNNAVSRRASRAAQTMTLLPSAGLRPKNMRANMSTARGSRSFDLASEYMEKNQAFQAIKNDDDKLHAMMHGGNSEAGIRAQLLKRAPGRFSEANPDDLNNAVAEVMRAKKGAGEQVGLVAATRAQATTGTGFNYSDNVEDDMLDSIIRASGSDKGLAGRMLSEMRGATVQSGRGDIGGGGFANQAQIMDRRREALANLAAGRGEVIADSNSSTGYRSYTSADAKADIHKDVLNSNAGAAIAGKKRAVEELAPVMLSSAQEALASTDTAAGARAIASLAGKYDVAAQVAPQNAEVLATQVLGQKIDVASLSPQMRAKLDPLISNANEDGVNYQQVIEHLRATDPNFVTMRREYGNATAADIARRGNPDANPGQPDLGIPS